MEPPSQGGQCYHRGKVRRVREAALYMACTIRRGRCPHRPAGGHMGPPLQIPTDGADHRKHLIRHGLRPCYFPLKGKAEAVAAGLRRGPIIAPLVKGGWHRRKAVTGGFHQAKRFGSTESPTRLRREPPFTRGPGAHGAPLQSGGQVAPSSAPFGATFPPVGGRQRARRVVAPHIACTIRRGRCPHRPAGGHMGPPLQKASPFQGEGTARPGGRALHGKGFGGAP